MDLQILPSLGPPPPPIPLLPALFCPPLSLWHSVWYLTALVDVGSSSLSVVSSWICYALMSQHSTFPYQQQPVMSTGVGEWSWEGSQGIKVLLDIPEGLDTWLLFLVANASHFSLHHISFGLQQWSSKSYLDLEDFVNGVGVEGRLGSTASITILQAFSSICPS